jgi:hypothetical protein
MPAGEVRGGSSTVATHANGVADDFLSYPRAKLVTAVHEGGDTVGAMTETRELNALRDYLRGQRSGDVEVLDTHVEQLLDEYMEDYIQLTLIVNDPAPGLQVWPPEDTRELRTRAYEEARRLQIPLRVIARIGSLRSYGQFVRGDR